MNKKILKIAVAIRTTKNLQKKDSKSNINITTFKYSQFIKVIYSMKKKTITYDIH